MSDDLFVLKEEPDKGALKDGVSYLGAPDTAPAPPSGGGGTVEYATQAIIGHGTQLQRGGVLVTDAFANLHEVVSFDAPNEQADEHEASHFESPDGYKEFVAGVIDASEATASVNWRPDVYPDQAALRIDAADKLLRYYRLILPGAMETITFRAFVKGLKPDINPNGVLTMAVTFRVSRVTVA